MKTTDLALIPIAEFETLDQEAMLYVLGGKKPNSKNCSFTCGVFNCGTLAGDPVCDPFQCDSYSRSSDKENK